MCLTVPMYLLDLFSVVPLSVPLNTFVSSICLFAMKSNLQPCRFRYSIQHCYVCATVWLTICNLSCPYHRPPICIWNIRSPFVFLSISPYLLLENDEKIKTKYYQNMHFYNHLIISIYLPYLCKFNIMSLKYYNKYDN